MYFKNTDACFESKLTGHMLVLVCTKITINSLLSIEILFYMLTKAGCHLNIIVLEEALYYKDWNKF